jgi:hypothetical protein
MSITWTRGTCPACGKRLSSYRDAVLDGDSVYYPFSCDCGCHGKEIYNLEYCETESD